MVSAARQVWFAPASVRIRHWPARLASHGPAGRSRPPGRSAPAFRSHDKPPAV